MTTPARQIAFSILNQVRQQRQTLDHWLEWAAPRIDRLNRADRALVHALVYGTLRWQNRLDHIIDHLADRPGKMDGRVRIMIRMALFQMHHMDRIPLSAAVNTAVALAKANRCAWAAGFVNGLLRRAAAGTGQIPWPDPTQSPADALALEHALPRWLTARWIDRWGVETTGRLGVFLNTIPDITLRTNTLKTDRRRLMAAIEKEARRLSITQRSPEGVRLAQLARPITQMPAYRKGWFQVQDEAAQLVSHLLAPRPDETVWDACAGLGTKSGHLAQLMKNRGTIVATDISSTKRDCLGREMQRLGVAIVHGHAADLTTPASLPQLPMFDRILMDAPCSGLGVLQKNPDGKWRHAPEDLFAYHQRQVIMLDTASRRLRPGGRLVYAVCSMEPEENESVVKAFLQSHPEFAIDSCGTNLADIATALGDALNSEGCLRSFPHQHGMDGFFAASLMKQA